MNDRTRLHPECINDPAGIITKDPDERIYPDDRIWPDPVPWGPIMPGGWS